MRTTETTDGPALPDVLMHLHRPNAPGTGVVVENEICTNRKPAAFVRHIAIDVSKTELAGNFKAGQSFGVIPPGVDAKGKPHKLRLYSIASPTSGEDGEGNVLSTTVKRVLDEHWDDHTLFLGVASNYLCDLQPGDEVQVTGPNGKRFLLPADVDAHDFVFFATGTGIAPFRGMLLELFARNADSRITLVMGSPYRTDLLYDAEFRELAEQHENFTYLTALSRQDQDDGAGPMYVQQRLDTNPDDLLPLLRSDRGLIYVCGLAGMELGIFQRLAGVLEGGELARYLRVDPEAMEDVPGWTRRMLHKQVSPTRRVFLEVY